MAIEPQNLASFQDYEKSLETPREVLLPEGISAKRVREITETVFMDHCPKPADVLFIFGTVQANWQALAEEILNGSYKKVVLAGRIGPNYFDRGIPIAIEMKEKLEAHGVLPEALHFQSESDNTAEDVRFSLGLIGDPESITYAAKAHHSGRCRRSLRKFFPNIPFNAHLIDAAYGEITVSKVNWAETEVGKGRVYGEFQRILKYSAKGDISEEV